MEEKFDANKTVELRWLINNETGERILVDVKTGKIIGKHRKTEKCPLCGK